MASVYSQLLARGTIGAGTSANVYTAPGAGVVIVRSVLFTPFGVGGIGYLLIAGGANICSGGPAVYVSEVFNNDIRAVLEPGDVLEVVAVTSAVAYYISGYLLN